MARLTVGLTGGLASGKSTVARQLAAAGFTVVDADRLVAELYEGDQAGARAVAGLFGNEILDAQGRVDKERLARQVFADPEARERLEAAIHPLVRRRFREIAQATDGVAVLEATKLVEAGFVPDFDLVVTVEAPAEQRLARAVRRGLSEPQARARLAVQASETERRAGASRVLENRGTLADLAAETKRLIRDLRALGAPPGA